MKATKTTNATNGMLIAFDEWKVANLILRQDQQLATLFKTLFQDNVVTMHARYSSRVAILRPKYLIRS